jgi:hypothetical protein
VSVFERSLKLSSLPTIWWHSFEDGVQAIRSPTHLDSSTTPLANTPNSHLHTQLDSSGCLRNHLSRPYPAPYLITGSSSKRKRSPNLRPRLNLVQTVCKVLACRIRRHLFHLRRINHLSKTSRLDNPRQRPVDNHLAESPCPAWPSLALVQELRLLRCCLIEPALCLLRLSLLR